MLSLAIAAVVLAAINTVFFAAIHLRERSAEVTEATLPMDRVVSVMKRDLSGIVYHTNSQLTGVMASDMAPVGMTQPALLEIFTTSGTITEDSAFGDIQRVDYVLQHPTNRTASTGRDLIRNVTRNLLAPTPETPQPQLLIGDVQQLKFTYYDGTNWLDAWSQTLSNTPVAIKVHIGFNVPKSGRSANPPIDFLVPVVLSTSSATNSAD